MYNIKHTRHHFGKKNLPWTLKPEKYKINILAVQKGFTNIFLIKLSEVNGF